MCCWPRVISQRAYFLLHSLFLLYFAISMPGTQPPVYGKQPPDKITFSITHLNGDNDALFAGG